jgi:hypothetical protein
LNDTVGSHVFVTQMFGLAIGKTPGAAMNFDQRRKRARPARPEHTGQEWLVVMAQIFDVIHVVGCLACMVLRIQNDSRHGEKLLGRDVI